LVVRRLPGERDRARRYQIVVDGAPVGSIAEADTLAVALPQGVHSIYFKLDFLRSRVAVVQISEESPTVLLCGSGALDRADVDFFRRRSYIHVADESDEDWLVDIGRSSPINKFCNRAAMTVLIVLIVLLAVSGLSVFPGVLIALGGGFLAYLIGVAIRQRSFHHREGICTPPAAE
jgi:hypothetical protein